MTNSITIYLDAEGKQVEESRAKLELETDFPAPTPLPDLTIVPETPMPTIMWPTDTPLPSPSPSPSPSPQLLEPLPFKHIHKRFFVILYILPGDFCFLGKCFITYRMKFSRYLWDLGRNQPELHGL